MTVGLIYLACLTLGLGYALWTGLLGPLFGGDGDSGDGGGDGGGDAGDMGADSGDFGADGADGGGGDYGEGGHGNAYGGDNAHTGEVHFSPISPNVLSAFLASFGALGVIGHYALSLAWWRSLILALSSGFIIAAAFYYVIKSLYSITQASSEAHVREMIGETAEVTTMIEAGKTGEIVYVSLGTRYQSPARCTNPEAEIPRGSTVVIIRNEDGIYYVEPVKV